MTRRPVGTLSNALLLFALILAITSARSCEERRPSSGDSVSTPVTNPVADQLKQEAPVASRREGIAAAILVDTSGSMGERVREADGSRRQKMEIARRAALNLVKEFDSFARGHSDQVIYVGIYEFSGRERGPSARSVVTLGPPDPAVAE